MKEQWLKPLLFTLFLVCNPWKMSAQQPIEILYHKKASEKELKPAVRFTYFENRAYLSEKGYKIQVVTDYNLEALVNITGSFRVC